MAINGTAVAITSLGGLLLYSAVKGAGIGDTARSLISGKAVGTAPTPGVSGAAALQGLLTDPLTSPGTIPTTPAPSSGTGPHYNAITGQWESSGSSGTGGGMASSINTYLKGMNFNRAQRAGIMGNMQIESGFNPNAFNANEGAIGICQWEHGRRLALQKFAITIGKSETDLAAQLAFFHLEMNSAFAAVHALIRASNDPGTVAAIVDASYEISAGTSRAARVSAARSLFASDVTA